MRVHKGFLLMWQAEGIQDAILKLLKEVLQQPAGAQPMRVLTCGHSLGARARILHARPTIACLAYALSAALQPGRQGIR